MSNYTNKKYHSQRGWVCEIRESLCYSAIVKLTFVSIHLVTNILLNTLVKISIFSYVL